MQWLRRRFLAGLLVTVPLVISVAALVWVFQVIDGFTAPLYARWLGRPVPGLGVVTTAAGVLLVGVFATNVIGRRVLQQGEHLLLRVPVFRTIYGTIKQVLAAFSPDSVQGFKRVVMADDPTRGFVLGFLTREFVVDRGRGPEPMVAMYVPTNHLYLGDVVAYPRDRVSFPDLSVEDGIRVFLTGGMALKARISARETGSHGGSAGV